MSRPPEMYERRGCIVRLRVLTEERDRWTRAADRAGVSLSAWLRGLANAAVPTTTKGGPARAKK